VSLNTTLTERTLGQTDVKVSPIGLGCNKFSGAKGVFRFVGPNLTQQEVNDIVQTALDGGIRLFDTAELYGNGHSERSLARALHAAGNANEEVIVATKWSPFFRTAGNITKTIDRRLRALEGYSIDLYMIHFPYSFSSIESEMAAMVELVKAGQIRTVGVSNFNGDQMRQAHAFLAKKGIPLAVNQVQYSLMHRKIESNGILAVAKELGITIIAWAPLKSGILTGRYHRDPQRLKEQSFFNRIRLRRDIERSNHLITALEDIGARYNATPAQIAVNWLVNYQGDTVVAIPGASKVHHAKQNAEAMTFRLNDSDMALLDDLSSSFR
jgi:aryl-alcohol dehydrogenase-like predicted oxidoreductase